MPEPSVKVARARAVPALVQIPMAKAVKLRLGSQGLKERVTRG